jgi:hypothetical protein
VAKRIFEHSTVIQAPTERVIDALSHYEYYLEHHLHRNLARVKLVSEVRGTDGIVRRRYRNSERVRLGPFPLWVSNTAMSYVDADGVTVVGEAVQWPRIHVMTRSRCTAQGAGATHVEEALIVEAPRVLFRTTFTQAKQAHEEKFVRLAQALAGQEPS